MSRWFRHYAGMMRDEKLVRVAVRCKQPVERVVWVWGAILESAAEINDGGRYDFDAAEAAYFLRCDEPELASIISELESGTRISGGVVNRWSDRQFDSDSAKERQRRYRERQKAGNDVQQRDDHVGEASRDVTRPSRDGAVTLQETDTEKREKETPSGVSKKRATRLSADWTIPDEWVAEAIAEGMPSSQAFAEAERMKNWSLSAPTGAKLDWHASWRNWYRDKLNKPVPRATAPPNTAPKPKSIGEMFRDDARRMGLIDDEPIHESTGRMEARNGVGQGGGDGFARHITLTADDAGGTGQGSVLRRS